MEQWDHLWFCTKEGKCEVNHIDGNKTNNNVNNLEWCTRQENNLHAKSLGAKQYSSDFRGIKIAQYDINNTLVTVELKEK